MLLCCQMTFIYTTRYKTLIFWLYTEPEVLHPRLDARVDQMLQVQLFLLLFFSLFDFKITSEVYSKKSKSYEQSQGSIEEAQIKEVITRPRLKRPTMSPLCFKPLVYFPS